MITLGYQKLEMPLEFIFTISRGSLQQAETMLVTLEYEGHTAYGEAVPSRFYGESAGSVRGFYDWLVSEKALEELDPFNQQELDDVWTKYANLYSGNMAAKSGIDIAFHDLRGKLLGIPLYKLWGLDPKRAPKTSYTIGIADLETVRHKTETALSRRYDVLKVKLGCPDDMEILKLIREMAPNATIRVDANAAWTVNDALRMGDVMAGMGVEFVEEPLLLTSTDEDYARLKEKIAIPVMADESCKTLKDIPRCAEFFHAINLKHTKTGGLAEAHRMIHAARAHDLKIMLGCFAESSVSITAFAHLSPLVDYADLDGALLVADDPFTGVTFEGSQICLPQTAGLGVAHK